MTALNLIVQPRAGASFLLTDTATYRPSGKICSFHSKVMGIHLADGSHIALASSGMVSGKALRGALRDVRARTLDGFLSAFKALFPEIVAELLARGAGARGDDTLSIVLACFDASSGRPAGYVISNGNACFPVEHYRPWELKPVDKHFTRYPLELDPFPEVPREGLSAQFDPRLPRHWNPERDGVALLEAQRADLFGRPGEEFFAVGGEGMLTRVDRDGITHRTLCAWPDRVGRKIDPQFTEWSAITQARAWCRQRLRPAPRIHLAA